MVNNKDNINKNTQGQNPASPDGITQSDNGAPNKSSVVAVDSRGNVIGKDGGGSSGGGVATTTGTGTGTGTTAANASNQAFDAQRTGNLPNQPPGGNTNALAQPGEPTNPPNPQGQNATQPAGAQAGSGTVGGTGTGVDTGLDINKLITESTQEIKTGDEAQEARKKKQEMLMTAINSRSYMETIIYKNEETQEEVGRKLRYNKDPYGKTIYDYMNDPEVTNHLGFKVDDSDPRDGSFIEKQISIYWIDPVF